MAWDVTLEGTITKRTIDDTGFEYVFPLVIITTNTANDTMNVKPRYGAPAFQVEFDEITTDHGATNIEEYVDYLAQNNYFE